jgi:ATP-dependent protease ClpP protease subunit
MSNDRTQANQFVSSGIDWQNRKIYWGLLDQTDPEETFCWATVERMIRAMHKMYELNSKPIELHFSSPGGDIYQMIRLMDEIEAAPCQIKFIGSGLIMSAAVWVMCVCDHRVLMKNTVVMAHDGEDGFSGSHSDAQIQALHNKKLQDKLYDVFANNSRMPKQFWQELCNRDLYLTASECIDLGICDEIIQPRKRGNVRKLRQHSLNSHPEISEIQKLTKELYSRIGRRKPTKMEISVKQDEVEETLSTVVDESISQA